MTETLRTVSDDATDEQAAVSLPHRRLSRRALMKAAGIAPFIALARQAWAQPTPKLMAAVAEIAPIPSEQLENAKKDAQEHVKKTKKQELDLDKFELVARALWVHFYLALGTMRPDKELEKKLLKVMYDEPAKSGVKTGERVAENIADGKFDPLGNDYQTNVCAYICGHKVAVKALSNGGVFDEKMYKDARKETEAEMCDKLSKICGPDSSAEHRGFGC